MDRETAGTWALLTVIFGVPLVMNWWPVIELAAAAIRSRNG